MDRDSLIKLLDTKYACMEAMKWIIATPGTPQELWEKCVVGDWMLWFCSRVFIPPVRALQEIACDIAELTLPHHNDPLTREAYEAARNFLSGKVTLEELNNVYWETVEQIEDTYANVSLAVIHACESIIDVNLSTSKARAAAISARHAAAAAADFDHQSIDAQKFHAMIVRRHIPKIPLEPHQPRSPVMC